MKKIVILMTMSVFIVSAFTLNAQKVKLVSGDPAQLKAEKEILISFSYDGMAVGKFDKEDEYTKSKVEEYNKKEAGKGDKWIVAWNNDKKQKFQPGFETNFNNFLVNKGIKVSSDFKKAKYTMIVRTVFLEPGFNVGVVRKDASIDIEVTIIETANPKAEVAKFTVNKIAGGGAAGFDFDSGYRLLKAYEFAGTIVAKYFAKNVYK
ncbi:MAG: hypothetical protein M0R21_03760 [Lentimicrobiaceae bacterium]|nr:hypothetical protein [Lentimicrobiaceae bacterium]